MYSKLDGPSGVTGEGTPGAYPIPAGRRRTELVERRSRFVATAARASTVDEARAFIDEIRAEMPDATHHVYAFAVGHGGTVTHGMSDAGEPSGTAGRPALAVVQGSGLGDVCVVITRYYGGTKLGTGGLVRAYTQAAQHVLAEMPRELKVETMEMELEAPYSLYEHVRRIIADHGGEVTDEQFGAAVALRAKLAVDDVPAFESALAELSSGTVRARAVDQVAPRDAQG